LSEPALSLALMVKAPNSLNFHLNIINIPPDTKSGSLPRGLTQQGEGSHCGSLLCIFNDGCNMSSEKNWRAYHTTGFFFNDFFNGFGQVVLMFLTGVGHWWAQKLILVRNCGLEKYDQQIQMTAQQWHPHSQFDRLFSVSSNELAAYLIEQFLVRLRTISPVEILESVWWYVLARWWAVLPYTNFVICLARLPVITEVRPKKCSETDILSVSWRNDFCYPTQREEVLEFI
jgi:hypothetical protein